MQHITNIYNILYYDGKHGLYQHPFYNQKWCSNCFRDNTIIHYILYITVSILVSLFVRSCDSTDYLYVMSINCILNYSEDCAVLSSIVVEMQLTRSSLIYCFNVATVLCIYSSWCNFTVASEILSRNSTKTATLNLLSQMKKEIETIILLRVKIRFLLPYAEKQLFPEFLTTSWCWSLFVALLQTIGLQENKCTVVTFLIPVQCSVFV